MLSNTTAIVKPSFHADAGRITGLNHPPGTGCGCPPRPLRRPSLPAIAALFRRGGPRDNGPAPVSLDALFSDRLARVAESLSRRRRPSSMHRHRLRDVGGNPSGQPGCLAVSGHRDRVGSRSGTAVAPAGRDCDADRSRAGLPFLRNAVEALRGLPANGLPAPIVSEKGVH